VTAIVNEPLSAESTRLLLTEVVRSRDALTAARRRQAESGTSTVVVARQELVAALAAYTACLVAGGVPVPYRMRDELRLLRGLDLPRP
jgi:hypothetical protein